MELGVWNLGFEVCGVWSFESDTQTSHLGGLRVSLGGGAYWAAVLLVTAVERTWNIKASQNQNLALTVLFVTMALTVLFVSWDLEENRSSSV